MNAHGFLSVEDLAIEFSTAYGPVNALRGVSFGMERGEVLGIVGESGSGKTVACRSIMRLLADNARIVSGRLGFEGQDILALDERGLRKLRGERIAMIFQNPSTHLDPLVPVGRQVGEAGDFRPYPRAVGDPDVVEIKDGRHRPASLART